ncbi:tRNA (adenosine(37)-N6)-threonylcarbamoyltransferase complex ATPase subunit type 1 TsaE [Patescibacteria group bacterium]|nr:tRNA (adenosine(37)-N6)-threonylcarbamoyltransferase complex ATPase subunit type 1 TsaE [Patescibacteria group bacterium]
MNSIKEYISHSPEETFAIAQKFAGTLKGGEVLALFGNLGAGKTAFVQGLAAGLGVKVQVNSPTFAIMKLYQANRAKIKQLCHVDTYRLSSSSELSDIGISDYFNQADTITAIEWAEKVKDILPKELIVIKLVASEENIRKIEIKKPY